MMAAGIAAPADIMAMPTATVALRFAPFAASTGPFGILGASRYRRLGLRSLRARQCFLFETRLDERTLLRPVDALPEASFDLVFRKPIEFGKELLLLDLRHERLRVST
jgi:hypothetical protein